VERILLGPGPSLTPPGVQAAMVRPPLSHMDPALMPLLEETSAFLRQVFQTSNELAYPLSGTGTAGMEAALVNLLSPGDRIVVASSGFFAHRIAEIAARLGADVATVEAPWGQAVPPDAAARALRAGRTKVLASAHVETSTGVLQPVREMAALAREHGALMLVDAVASLGGAELRVDEWGIDVCYSGSQKCLSAPPGMAPLTASARARSLARERTVPSFYLDLELIWRYWAPPHAYHHTVPVPLVFAVHEALRLAVAEGLPARWARHAANAAAFASGIEAMGLDLFAPRAVRAPTVVTIVVPDGADEARVRGRLLDEYGIEIAGGLGPLGGKIWRVGLMGHSAQDRLVLLLLTALEAVLVSEGVRVERGAGIAAASRVLAATSAA
jgi:alanine-glyoxylate transaminase/serine-glyoxylate transaminase/serine-pyruvate transaminase